MKRKFNIKIVFLVFLTYFLAFERELLEIWNGFAYIDELFCIFCVFLILLNYNRLNKEEKKPLLLLIIIIIIGLIGNYYSRIQKSIFYILVDIISIIKVLLSFYLIALSEQSTLFYDTLIKKLAFWGKISVYIMLICYIATNINIINMQSGIRYGINSFRFVFNNAGNFSKYFYFLIPLLSADLYYKRTIPKLITIIIALFLWLTSLRTRSFVFVIIYIILYFLLISKGKKTKQLTKEIKSKIKLINILPVVIISIVFAKNKLEFYFTNSNQTRYQLLIYSFVTANKFIPIGAGFGTYGSDVAAVNYSPLYKEYGFEKIYGMGYISRNFLNDNYWPMIIGQFGYIGTIIMIICLFSFMKIILKKCQNNNFFYFSAFYALLVLLLSSVASKSYSEFTSISIFIVLSILYKREKINIQNGEI